MADQHPITPPPELFKQWEFLPRTVAFEAAYRAGAALADEPAVPEGREPAAVTGQPSDEELESFLVDVAAQHGDIYWAEPLVLARAVLARWGRPVPAPPADAEVARLVAALRNQYRWTQLTDGQLDRVAELLERQVPVPVAVSDALIKAECALADIAEGAPMSDEGDPLQWAERRCADTLAIIRPTMRQHKILTSEWPPATAHALPLPEVDE